jgi:DivIVA domain-containing protein
MRSEDVAAKKFGMTRWREGYEPTEVDELMERVRETLAGYERRRSINPITSAEVVAALFAPTKFREGYDQNHVDDFLDEIVAALREHEAR